MRNPYYLHLLLGIVNEVEDSIIPHPDSIGVFPMELLDSHRSWICFKAHSLAFDSLKHLAFKRVEFFLGRFLEDNLVGHC